VNHATVIHVRDPNGGVATTTLETFINEIGFDEEEAAEIEALLEAVGKVTIWDGGESPVCEISLCTEPTLDQGEQ
jgi:hypothetical protein